LVSKYKKVFYCGRYLKGMITLGENRLNCCESTLMIVNDKLVLPEFGKCVLRQASNMGGGVAGWGSGCGAVTGAAMAIGLMLGTDGDEDPHMFKAKREHMRDVTQIFLRAFEEKWGSINCTPLLGVDRRTDEGKKEYERLKAKGVFHCD
jgi:C_GCAxxG_C_C family probable redox protein